MNYNTFYQKLKGYPLFSTDDLKMILGTEFTSSTIINLQNWQKKNQVIQLRRGLYFLPSFDKAKIKPDMLAARLYEPSYVSLEYALSYYGIIPEAVFTITSVSTRKTAHFLVEGIGNYSYQKIKKEAFGGYGTYLENGVSYNLAEPEKALLDFFYLNRHLMDGSRANFDSYRFNETFRYNKTRMKELVVYFKDKKTTYLSNKFIEFYPTKKKEGK
ncbi:MAG: hypothetical protein Q7S80_01205 [bacterium]|nr:hypothetical protein [bacterium]